MQPQHKFVSHKAHAVIDAVEAYDLVNTCINVLGHLEQRKVGRGNETGIQ